MRYSNACALVALMAFQSVMLTYCQVITKHERCPTKCGNVTIPYPFGIGQDCAFNKNFIIHCNQTENPPTPSLSANGSLPILDISVDGYLRKYTYVTHDCYNQTGGDRDNFNATSALGSTHFYSSTQNKFTAIGCDTRSELDGATQGGDTQFDYDGGPRTNGTFALGCISYCVNISTVSNGSCSGIGCCQTALPSGLSSFYVKLRSYMGHIYVHDFNPCSYAFIADKDYFHFTTASMLKMPNVVPTVVDWVIANVSCDAARRNANTYACKNRHSECSDYENGLGYRCSCSSGYAGNPYLPDGCHDVDECKNENENECVHKCHNLEGDKGNYTCSCPKWYHGDGRRTGEGCKLNKHSIFLVILGDGILLVVIVVGILMLYTYRRKRMQDILKEKFFKQNGGFILLDRISHSQEGLNSISTMRIFKSKELKEATNNFSEDEICGRGGFGTVYKGRLWNGTIVAIKKSKEVNQDQVEQFINEIIILSQINHKNVVKFLGCCLEQAVPLLVYEFVTNGTLSNHIHDYGNRPKMLWQTRLKIAAETAGFLAYLHADHSPQIIHRDIKPTNILLDDGLTPKISDFGASRLNPKNEIEMCTMVQGTMGYLDPEYFQTSQLTEKSDVYSFGVVLIELLTGLKVVSFERAEDDRNLVLYFMSLKKKDDILRILDKTMMKEGNIEEIKQVLKIAKMCIRVKGEERPTMKEVAMELEGLHNNIRRQWIKNETKFEESEHLLDEISSNEYSDSIEMTGYSSKLEDHFLTVDDGR